MNRFAVSGHIEHGDGTSTYIRDEYESYDDARIASGSLTGGDICILGAEPIPAGPIR